MEALLFAAQAKALDSRLRGNDEPRRDGRRVGDPLAAGEWMLMLRKIETKALDSRLRGNDEPRRDGRRVSDPLAEGVAPAYSTVLRGNDERSAKPTRAARVATFRHISPHIRNVSSQRCNLYD